MDGKRPIRGALQVGALLLFLLLLPAPLLGASTETAAVRSVLDGDSLLLEDGRQVRLLGINAPEFGKDGRSDQPLARAARDRASELARGRTIRLIYDQERQDRYGRTLAYATLPDGRDLEATLVREGLAWFVAIPPNLAHLEPHRAAEAEARVARRGVWAQPEYEPVSAAQLTRDHTGFIRLTGRISAVHLRQDTAELVLAPHVRLVMSAGVLAALGKSPEDLRGKHILARGWLSAYKDQLRLRITHSAMIEAL